MCFNSAAVGITRILSNLDHASLPVDFGGSTTTVVYLRAPDTLTKLQTLGKKINAQTSR